MPIFDTPAPVDVTIDVFSGDVRVTATDRTDTTVEVLPADAREAKDVEAAEQTRVEFADGKLLVKTPKPRGLSYVRAKWSVEVHVEVPTGSTLRGDTGMGDFRVTGELGECRLKSGSGHIEVDQAGPVHLRTSGGHVTVEAVTGTADVSTASGTVRIGRVDGEAVVKNSNGPTTIGRVGGDLRVRSSNGDITVAAAAGGVDAKSANGTIRVDEVVRGSIVLKTSTGDLEVGVAEGTAAWLDVNTSQGRVRNSLDESRERPDRGDTVEVRAATSFGDVTIRRS
ncbi:DUF4097 family beta strand repeat-containing protein [Umezawaea sp.]|uniref:DUF4097 family beta strand repeat-containing protein n=1 Tax=Umezawaea sp. TaxID=1955258 RepID=UPI002ED23F87